MAQREFKVRDIVEIYMHWQAGESVRRIVKSSQLLLRETRPSESLAPLGVSVAKLVPSLFLGFITRIDQTNL